MKALEAKRVMSLSHVTTVGRSCESQFNFKFFRTYEPVQQDLVIEGVQ